MGIKIGHQTLTWKSYPMEYSIEEILKEVKESGYEGVEFSQSLEQLGAPGELKRLLEKYSLTLGSLSCVVSDKKDGGEEMKVIKERAEYGAKFGIKALMVCAGFLSVRDREKAQGDFSILRDKMENLAEYVSQFGMEIAMHPHIGCIVETKEDIDRFYSELSLKTKLCIDIGHLKAKGSDPIETILVYKDKIIHFHLKDYNSEGEGRFVELGGGNIGIDIPKAMKTIEEINFNGWAMVELDMTTVDSPLKSAKISREYLRKIGY